MAQWDKAQEAESVWLNPGSGEASEDRERAAAEFPSMDPHGGGAMRLTPPHRAPAPTSPPSRTLLSLLEHGTCGGRYVLLIHVPALRLR